MKLAEMTWPEVADYLKKSDALLVPLGTCEQHGPHLPLSCDTLIAEAFAEAVGERTGIAVAPTLAYGVNLPCDRFVPGNAGLSPDGLRECVRGLLGDWSRQGFRTFFIVTAHGCAVDGFGFGHHEAIKQAALPVLEEGGGRVFVLFPYWIGLDDLLERQTGVEHAGEVETSLGLYLFPDRVHMDRAVDGPAEEDEARYEAFPEGVALGPPAAGWFGAEGSPTAGTAEKGRAIFERCLERLVEVVARATGP